MFDWKDYAEDNGFAFAENWDFGMMPGRLF
jgi:hypothetical protein